MSCHTPILADLREHGVRLTAQRALILEDLYHHPGHCTADAIFGRVSQSLPGLNRATVYRTLEFLRDAGVLTASTGPEGVNRFELVQDRGPQHHHLHCRKCGVERDLDAEPIDALKAEIARRSGFRAELDHLYINGLCATCDDLRLVRELLPRTVVMDAGAIVADGLTADILSDAALLEAHGLEVY